jgi:hypothetical protein
VVGNVKAAPLEDDGGGMKNAAGGLFTLRAFSLRLVLKALLHLETVTAAAALVFISRHGKIPHTTGPL